MKQDANGPQQAESTEHLAAITEQAPSHLPPPSKGEAAAEAPPPSRVARGIFSVLFVLLISTFPVFFLYLRNISEVDFATAAPVLGLFTGIACLLFLLMLLFTHSMPVAAVCTAIAMLVFQNYMPIQGLVQAVFSGAKYYQILPVLIILLLHLFYLIHRKLPKIAAFRAVQLLCIGFGAVFLVTTATAIPTIAAKMKVESTAEASLQTAQYAGEHPNIYYFIFDEYSRFDMLEKYFNYDNTTLIDFLNERGFNTSYSSVNERASTTHVTANLMMLDNVARTFAPENQLQDYRQNGTLHSLLANFGYEEFGVGQSDYFGIPSQTYQAAGDEAATVEGTSFSDLLLQKTPLEPFLKVDSATDRARSLFDVRDYFQNANNYPTLHNRFTLSYLSFPHEPFTFTETGAFNDPSNWSNWKDPAYYRGQLIYTTEIMKEMVDGILANDPNSIIIIQSDHGARTLVTDAETGAIIPGEDRIKILNTVYYQGEKFDIEGLTGINTLRAVLSKAMGANLPPVEVHIYELPGQT